MHLRASLAIGTPRGRSRPHARRSSGFSLVEVMVALVVTSVGLLGLAKMESLALSSTNVAGSRAIAAIEASSLAAAMHADPGYWAAGKAPGSFTVYYDVNNVLQISDGSTGLATPVAACSTTGSGSCNPTNLAAYDLQQWANDVNTVLPAPLSTITCTTSGFPVTCTIMIQWTEGSVAANSAQTNLANLSTPTYTLTVQP